MRGRLAVGALLLSPILIPFAIRGVVRVTGERLDWASWRLAGRNATDCGLVPGNGNAYEASNCVLSAVRARKPFRLRYEVFDVDALETFGLVGDPDGNVYELHSSSGGWSPTFGGVVEIKRCPVPVIFGKLIDERYGKPRDRGMIRCVDRTR